MGLDGVELIMAVEEKFGIEIADEEAQNVLTPRILYELVEKKIRTIPTELCHSQRGFYILRRAFRAQFATNRKAFRPGVALDSLVPRQDRRRHWEELKRNLGALNWPKLKFPRVASFGIFAAILIVAGWTYSWARGSEGLILASLSIGVSALVIIPLAAPLRTSLAGQTVGSLSNFLVTSNSFLVAPMADAWTRESIRLQIRKIIVEQLGISPDFSDCASFVEDLGVD
jgi:acyl carrier protein